MKEVIFFLEDDESINKLIKVTLEKNNFESYGFLEPLTFLKKLEEKTPDLIVLDLMLPYMNGFEIIKMLKEKKEYENIPIIILSAKSSELDVVHGLDMGASDYIIKPFGLLEFISRINTNIRKVNMYQNKIFKIRNLTLDLTKHQVFLNDKLLELTSKEFDLIKMLIESPSIVVTREQLLRKIWGFEYLAETRTLDMHIKFIREKMAKVTNDVYIETVRGVGYIINE